MPRAKKLDPPSPAGPILLYTEEMEIRENVPLAPLTTFKIGGAARYFTEVKNVDEIREALAWARDHKVKHNIIAGGSNLLIPDEGLDALIIRITAPIYGSMGDSIYGVSGNVVEAEAGRNSQQQADSRFLHESPFVVNSGCDLLGLIRRSAVAGLSGWERMAGIPGTFGGAIRGNAGAFGTEMKNVIESVQALDTTTDKIVNLQNLECEFVYRSSIFKKHPKLIILSAKVALKQGNRERSERLIEETITERERRHLQNVRAAGSFFMNPVAPREIQELFEKEKNTKAREGRVPAGWLIEKAGMKCARVGGAVASEQHPNYIVNESNATAADVLALTEQIRREVKGKFGVILSEEVSVFSARRTIFFDRN